MRVFVYYNLHRHLWSVKALEGPEKGRVIARYDSLVLRDATPRVSQAGRERVIREGRKNVHAGLVGTLVASGASVASNTVAGLPLHGDRRAITYNPYKYSSFVFRDDESAYTGSDYAVLTGRKVYTL